MGPKEVFGLVRSEWVLAADPAEYTVLTMCEIDHNPAASALALHVIVLSKSTAHARVPFGKLLDHTAPGTVQDDVCTTGEVHEVVYRCEGSLPFALNFEKLVFGKM